MKYLPICSFLLAASVIFAAEPMSKEAALQASRAICAPFVQETLRYGIDYAVKKKGLITRPIAQQLLSLEAEMKKARDSAKTYEEKEAIEIQYLRNLQELVDKVLPGIQPHCQKISDIMQKCTAYPEERSKECTKFESKKMFAEFRKVLIGR